MPKATTDCPPNFWRAQNRRESRMRLDAPFCDSTLAPLVLDGVASCGHDEAPAVVNGLMLAMAAQVAGRGTPG